MSSRALRRLQGDSTLAELAGNEEDESGDEHVDNDNPLPVSKKSQKKKKPGQLKQRNVPENPFDLLKESDAEDADAQDEEENHDGDFDKSETSAHQTEKAEPKTKKKKKKNKKKGKEKENVDQQDEEVKDDVDASVEEVNRILGQPGGASALQDPNSNTFSVNMKPLLHIDYRNLNPETELKRMFGSQVIRGEQPNRNRRQRNRPLQRSSRLVQPKDTWHSTGGSGLSMKFLGEKEGFTFEHSHVYQKLQHRFSDAVESGHPENIINVLRENPYHIDALIQMADFHRMNEDYQTAAESIEKALYGLECAFHPMFNLASGNCYLNYKRPENRALFLCLFKHILNLGRRGCNRTAFEFCKLLLSLDPADDPLDCLSMIDYYALRCEQYDHLVQLEQEVMNCDTMKQVPNFALSIPLAHFKIACRDGGDTRAADLMLQDKLIFFPMMLMPLLDQCSVQPDRRVSAHSFFSTAELNDSTSELGRLITMYVKRSEACWKDSDVMAWLERNVTAVLDIVDKGTDMRPQEYAKLRRQRFKRPPLPLLRHYFLAEIPGLGLPRQYLTTSVLNHDPFPPADSIISYTRPPRPTVASQDNMGVLRSLLQSILPSYNPYEPADAANRRLHGHAENEDNEDDEEGGARGIPQQIQQSVNAIMQAMRQLLNEPFVAPGAPVNEGEGQRDEQPEVEENEREWEEEEEEFQNNGGHR